MGERVIMRTAVDSLDAFAARSRQQRTPNGEKNIPLDRTLCAAGIREGMRIVRFRDKCLENTSIRLRKNEV